MAIPETKRLVVEISEETHNKLNNLLPWGSKQDFFRVVIDGVIENLETEKGNLFYALIMNRAVKIKLEPIDANAVKSKN
jgi:hypothetical protein